MDSDFGSGLALALALALGFSTHPIRARGQSVRYSQPSLGQSSCHGHEDLSLPWGANTAGSNQVTRLCPKIN